jgi:hypothetical protein
LHESEKSFEFFLRSGFSESDDLSHILELRFSTSSRDDMTQKLEILLEKGALIPGEFDLGVC